ncbi:MAG: hypothetical protein U0Q11_25125 [Vicinamibacterales bacterium]
MPNKGIERWYLEQLRKSLPDFPVGDVDADESPDFLIRGADGVIGVELTVYHRPPPVGQKPHQEQQSLKDAVVNRASRLHQEMGGPALYVTVFFHEPISFNKRNAQLVAEALVEAVAKTCLPSSFEEGSRDVQWDHLPPGVVAISVHASIDGNDQLWSANAGGWVASVAAEDIEGVLQAKQTMLAPARTKCRRVWLVIVNDKFSRAAPVELSHDASQTAYDHEFDRLIWLEPHAPRSTELPKAG